MKPLPASFFARSADVVAEALIGTRLVRNELVARLVETEAYLGPHDLACHSAKGRTKRTEVMFGPPGFAYVYLIYGMYDMLNVVTGAGTGEAVLVRAAEPLSGWPEGTRLDGPGKLARAFGITRAENGLALGSPALAICEGKGAVRVVRSKRVGIDYAKEWRDAPLRFCDADSRSLSR